MAQQHLHVYSASAGSGKTFTLVTEFLALALSSPNTAYYQRILAITFTNKAAGEMKARIMDTLEHLGSPDYSAERKALLKRTELPEAQLLSRAEKVHLHMLHHYGELSVQTIDSFMHGVIRNFARDLDLDPEFEVLVGTDLHLATVVDDMLERLGQAGAEELDQLMAQFSDRAMEDEKSWDVREGLLAFIQKRLASSDFVRHLTPLLGLAPEALRSIRARIDATLRETVEKRHIAAAGFSRVLQERSLGPEDFIRQSVPKWFEKQAALKPGVAPERLLPTPAVVKQLLGEADFHKKKTSEETVARLNNARDALKSLAIPSALELRAYTAAFAVRKWWLELEIAVRFIGEWKNYLARHSYLPVGDFQHRMAQVVGQGPTPFIYERLGQRYRHIMMDEFQDTSSLQWDNFRPLVEGTIAIGMESLIVGDGKQSIYRWRDANVQQFRALTSAEAATGQTAEFRALRQQTTLHTLDTNWRTAPLVVAFNNHVFAQLGSFAEGLSDVYAGAAQRPGRQFNGRVVVQAIEGDKRELREPLVRDFYLESVRAASASGFSYGEMVVLVRTGREGALAADVLREAGITPATSESLFLGESKRVRLLVTLLHVAMLPLDETAAVQLLLLLADRSGEPPPPDWFERYQRFVGKRRTVDGSALLSGEFPHIDFAGMRTQSAYEQLGCWVVELGWPSTVDPLVERLLEAARTLMEGGQPSGREFLAWWESKGKSTSATAPPGADAVRIMTVHKSKGLEFPVVIYASPDFSESNKSVIWLEAGTIPGVEVPLPMTFSGKYAAFLPEASEEAEQQRLDHLNVAYVATTRPEYQLYLGLEMTNASGETFNAQWLRSVEQFQQHGPSDSGKYVFEDASKETPKSAAETLESVALEWPFRPAHEQLDMAFQFREDREEAATSRELGVYVHDLLAGLHRSDDPEEAVNRHWKSGWGAEEQRASLVAAVESLLEDAVSQHWFDAHAVSFIERELVTADGVRRPDRVTLLSDRVIVVDYKTGSPQTKDTAQVRAYMVALASLYPKHTVEGYLFYVFAKNDRLQRVR